MDAISTATTLQPATAGPPVSLPGTTEQFADTLRRLRIVPVVVLNDAGDGAPLGEALAAAGLPVAEVTFRTPAAEAGLRAMAANPDLLVGAGTVVTADQVDRAVAAGARFVVSPGFSAAVVQRCRDLGVPVLPGVATATDLMTAVAAGIDVVKFFPAEPMGGARMVAALAAPFRTVRFVPTGGIDRSKLAPYLALDAVLAVGGSWMVSPALLAARDWSAVTALAADAVAAARSEGED